MTVIRMEVVMALPDSISERARRGAQVRREVLGAAYVDAGKQKANPFTEHFIEFTQTQCWGNVWLREGLSRKTRSMLNVCMLAALARWHEFEVHVRGALNNGVTPEEIAEILLHTAVYAGIPIASEGFRRANQVITAVAAEQT
jgi:4-carboxymuconolactone decarboxylase